MADNKTTTTTTAPKNSDDASTRDTLPLTAKERRPEEEQTQEQEIHDHRLEVAEKQDAVLQDARAGKEASFEGARPEYEPLPGEAKGSIPDGLTVGGPVLSLEEQERIARQRGASGSPVPKGKAENQKTSNT